MKTLLTVDWDYFVPIRPEWDLSHREAGFFLKPIWAFRIGLYDHISTTGSENGFWSRLESKIPVADGATWVSDSHLYAYSLLRGIDHVVLVDTHHDCWKRAVRNAIECSDWLGVWLRAGKNRRATWVKSEASDGSFSLPDGLKGKVREIHESDDWKVKGIDRVHVCRSGCWTPPWLDRKFIEFVESRGCRYVSQQEGDWDPMKERWNAEEMKKILEDGRILIQQRNSLRTADVIL